MRWNNKAKFNATTFWSVFLLILILGAVIFFFFGNAFITNKIDYEQVGGDVLSLKIQDYKKSGGSIEFYLDIKPRGNEITEIKFTIYSKNNKTEVYVDESSYLCRTQKKYDIDLFKFHSSQVHRIVIEPQYNVLNYLPECSPDINLSENYQRSMNNLRRIFEKE
jgi:hypothetical protein